MTQQITPITTRIHPALVKKVDQYLKQNETKLKVRRMDNRTALVNWFFLELVEGRIDPCRK